MRNADGLRFESAQGDPVPARPRVVSRWGGPPDDAARPIKWLEVTFAAREGLGGGLRVVRGEPARGDVRVITADDLVTVKTGDLTLVLERGSTRLFRSLALGGEALAAGGSGEVVAADEEGLPVAAAPWELAIESDHHAAATVLATTTVLDLDVALRLHVAAGSGQVVADFRVLNPGPYGHLDQPSAHVYFKRLGLTLPRRAGAIDLAGPGGLRVKPGDDAVVALLQTHETPPGLKLPAERLPYQVWVNGRRTGAGEKAPGVLVMEAGGIALGYAVERFWENAPKAMTLVGRSFVLDFFPLGGTGPHHRGRYGRPGHGPLDERSTEAYRFEGARAKTTRFILDVGRESAADGFARRRAAVDRPLHALPPPEAALATGALGYPYDVPRRSHGRAGARFERLMEMLVDDGAADSQPSLGRIGYPGFAARGGTYGEQVFYGWFNYGDIPWGDGYCSLHYDWPFVVLLSYLRTGDARFLELGREMARHRRDIDQDHDRTSSIAQRGGPFYEKGYYHGNYYHPSTSHTWVMGLLLHHLLTGDEASLEAARMNRDFVMRLTKRPWDGDWGSRGTGWSADVLTSFHWLFHDPEANARAERLFRDFEKIETEKYGGRGFVVNQRMKPPSMKPWMHCIVFNAVARHAWLTGSTEFRPLMERMTAFFRSRAIRAGRSGQPLRVFRNMNVDTRYRNDPSLHLAWPMAASFAFSHLVTGRREDRDLADRLFGGAVLHFQGGPGRPIAFRMLAFPGAESKILSNVGLWGHPVLPVLGR